MIACIGESLIDRIGGKELAGGCPFNTALAAARLGASVSFFGKFSSDRYGSVFLEKMIDSGLLFDPDLCNAPGHTMTSTAVTDENGNATYAFDCEGSAAADLTQAELEQSLAVASDIDIVFFGSISLLMKPIGDAVFPAIRNIRTKPALFFDPNIRPAMIKDPESVRNLVSAYAAQSDIVKVSEEDLAFLFPQTEASEAERQFAAKCKGSLIVTHGEKGSSWISRTFRADCPAVAVPSDEIADTIGCGDTFNGAVLACIEKEGLASRLAQLDRETAVSVLKYASRAAAVNCTREGCDPPFGDEL